MIASPAATTNAIPLSQTGTIAPFTVTSHRRMKRRNCSRAISDSTTTAIVVNGFTLCHALSPIARTARTWMPNSVAKSDRVQGIVFIE
jgi:hypothetical protein